MKDWHEWLDKYINENSLKKHKTFVIIVAVLFVYTICAKFLDVIKPTWIPENILTFLQIDMLNILAELIWLIICLTVLIFLLSLLSLFFKIKESFIRKVALLNGFPMWVCYRTEVKTRECDGNVREFLDTIYTKYKKKRIMILNEYPECYLIYGTANKTILDTSGKRKDVTVNEYLKFKLKNLGTQCIKFNIESIKIDENIVEIMDCPMFVCDLSKEKQEFIISINEICSNEEDFKNKFTSIDEMTLLIDLISYDLFKNKYLQTLNFSKRNGKWEFFVIDTKPI